MKRFLASGIVPISVASLLMFCFFSEAFASSLLFDRGLPTANLNNAAGRNRSNVAWADWEASQTPNEYWLPGDDFSLAGSVPYHLDQVRLWTVGNGSNLTLWGGPQGGTISPKSSSFAATPVTYSNGQNYQGTAAPLQIYQVDFAVNWDVDPDTTYQFFLDGPWTYFEKAPVFSNAFLHASNGALSGSTQEGSDDWFLWLHNNNGTLIVESWNSRTGAGTAGFGQAWDKSSSANVQVYGAPVPEPATLLLVGSGMAGLIRFRKKFRGSRCRSSEIP